MKHHQRKKILALSGVITLTALLVSGCASPQPVAPAAEESPVPIEPVTVALSYLKDITYAGNWIADDGGYYAEAGIAPDFLQGGPNAPAPEVTIASGEATIGYENNTIRLFSYLADTPDLVIIGVRFAKSPNGLLSLAANPILDANDLDGASIIAGAPNRPNVDALMALNDVTDYEFVVGGVDVGPLLAGAGDALLTIATAGPLVLEEQGMKEGKDYFFTPFSDLDYHQLSNVVVVSREYLESNRAQVVNFMAATIRGWQDQLDDPELGAQLAVDVYGVDLGLNLDAQTKSAAAELSYMNDRDNLFRFDPKDFDAVYEGLAKVGVTGLPPVKDIVDTTVLDDAYALLGAN
ncbi:MAG: myristoyl transferase [Rhodoglobus sp.]|nr:myristoyl transferase [Rhodoglobus sp.]